MRRFRPLRCPKCKSTKLEVFQRLCNFSAFSGYHWTPSRYSGVRCPSCPRVWRTRADVSYLPDMVFGGRGGGPPGPEAPTGGSNGA